MKQPPSHPAIIARLRRVEGHVRSIIGMIEAGKPCLDLAQQLHAVEAAVSKAKKELVHDHIDHCLVDAVDGTRRTARSALAEFKALTKYV